MKRVVPLTVLFFFSVTATLQSQEERVGLRLITVRTEAEAALSATKFRPEHHLKESPRHIPWILPRKTAVIWDFSHRSEAGSSSRPRGLMPGRISPVTPVDGAVLLIQRLALKKRTGWLLITPGLRRLKTGAMKTPRKIFCKPCVCGKADAGGRPSGRQSARAG